MGAGWSTAGLPSAASGWAQLHSPLQDHRLKATSLTPRHLTGATICYQTLPFESHCLRAGLWDFATRMHNQHFFNWGHCPVTARPLRGLRAILSYPLSSAEGADRLVKSGKGLCSACLLLQTCTRVTTVVQWAATPDELYGPGLG